MKIIHTADLHLGKVLNERSLLDLQEEMLNQFLEAVKEHGAKVLLIAGDIYDRSLPSKEAVDLLSRFLTTLCRDLGIQVVMIAGNHDSPERLGYAAALLSGMGLHIGGLEKSITKVEVKDVHIYALPYIDKRGLSALHEQDFGSLEEAMGHHLDGISLDPHAYNILMTHHYILGKEPLEESESERPLFLGTTENLSTSLFSTFDYVALGHIHKAQSIHEKMHYSGAPQKYSKSEASRTPSYILLDTESGEISTHPIHLSKDLLILRGEFHELMEGQGNDLCYIELEDKQLLPDAMSRLKTRYPEALGLSYIHLESALTKRTTAEMESMNHLELFKQFYEESTGHPLGEEEAELVRDSLERTLHETY